MLGEYKDQKQIAIVQDTEVGVGCRSAWMFNDKLLNLHFNFIMKVEPVERVCSSVYVDLFVF